MNYYVIGQKIRKYRKEQGLSQENLAEKVDISTTHMSHIETGSTKLSLPVLVDLSKVLKVSTDELLGIVDSSSQEAYIHEIVYLLQDCTEERQKIILDVIKTLKDSLEKGSV